ncbi:hypothetical protein GPECTOR_22g779 [Gonium pectorale]|uniref:mRNA export factor GLE1 n=1 Tax=Gonium pectorale TaxID=33097 RepID=A0A150GHC5_GONPE|nr:hypothetical protein GPECTOR_22g779 [Gonium pectorale]|eukprot:KXZ49189.1 hypothetical protein GPECTOR_22g779 [Gonium pectorale]
MTDRMAKVGLQVGKSCSQAGVVRYGLPIDELQVSERRSGATRSFSYRIPSDDEGDSDDESLQQDKQASWRVRLAEVEAQLAEKLSTVATSVLRKQMKQLMAQREEERRKEEERRRKEEEERQRREREQQEAERERRSKEEEAKRREEKKAAKAREVRQGAREEERKRQEADAEKQRQEAEAKAKKDAGAAGAKAHPCLRVAPAAAQEADRLAASLAEAQAAVEPLLADAGAKPQRRTIEKKLTVHVQQICGTQNQVNVKCQDVYAMLSGLAGPWRTFALLTLCRKVINQHELVQLNNKAAFPLALVVVKLSGPFPELMPLIVALIHKACPLAIPRSYVHDTAKISNNAYYRGMGFAELDDPSAPAGKVFESPDEYAKRLEGVMLLYGAIMQVDDPNPHGLPHAWSYLARSLNALPAERFAAKALVAVLRVAGYALHVRYRGQFVKLLGVMQREYIPALRASSGDDIGALATLLETYVTDGVYRRPPEGRNMPAFDISSLDGNRA